MIIKIPKTSENILTLMRRVGYSPDPSTRSARSGQVPEPSFSRRLSGVAFPRFHIYIAEESESWIFKLHLDQNRPKYEGTAAHGGEYDGPLVEQEAERIKSLL